MYEMSLIPLYLIYCIVSNEMESSDFSKVNSTWESTTIRKQDSGRSDGHKNDTFGVTTFCNRRYFVVFGIAIPRSQLKKSKYVLEL